MTAKAARLEIKSAKSLHVGETKHYALYMISLNQNSNLPLQILCRFHGAVGKKTRATIEAFSSTTLANDTFNSLMQKKAKGGYHDIEEVKVICDEVVGLDVDHPLTTAGAGSTLSRVLNGFGVICDTSLAPSQSIDLLTVLGDDLDRVEGLIRSYLKSSNIDPFQAEDHQEATPVFDRQEHYGEQWGAW